MQGFCKSDHCSASGCSNFGASYREGLFCSVHAADLGLQRATNGRCWRCEVLDDIPQRVGFGVVGGGWISLPGHHIPCGVENMVELPAPFTIIEKRSPVVGDYVVTLVECCNWMGNSLGRVVAVNGKNSTASIHLSCDSVYDLSFAHFVICGIAQPGAQLPVAADASDATSLQSLTETDAFPFLTLFVSAFAAAWMLLRLRDS